MVILKLFGRISFLLKSFFFINVWGPLSQPRFIFTTMKLTNVGTTYKKKKKLFRSIKILKKKEKEIEKRNWRLSVDIYTSSDDESKEIVKIKPGKA